MQIMNFTRVFRLFESRLLMLFSVVLLTADILEQIAANSEFFVVNKPF